MESEPEKEIYFDKESGRMYFVLMLVAALAASPALAGPGGQFAPAGVPTTMVVGDGEAGRYAATFAAYMGTFGAPAYAGRSQRGQQAAPEGEVLCRLTFGRQTTSRTRGDADFKVGDYHVERDSDSVTSRTVTVQLSGFGRTWAKTEVARESDSSWRVRGEDGEVEMPNRRSTGSALDATLQKLAKDAAAVIKAGATKAPAVHPPTIAIGTGGAVIQSSATDRSHELDPLFQAETAPARVCGAGFVLVSANPTHRPAPVVVSYDSKQLSKSSLLTVYGRDGRKCSVTVYWNNRYRAWCVEGVFPAVGGGMPSLGDRAELQ